MFTTIDNRESNQFDRPKLIISQIVKDDDKTNSICAEKVNPIAPSHLRIVNLHVVYAACWKTFRHSCVHRKNISVKVILFLAWLFAAPCAERLYISANRVCSVCSVCAQFGASSTEQANIDLDPLCVGYVWCTCTSKSNFLECYLILLYCLLFRFWGIDCWLFLLVCGKLIIIQSNTMHPE